MKILVVCKFLIAWPYCNSLYIPYVITLNCSVTRTCCKNLRISCLCALVSTVRCISITHTCIPITVNFLCKKILIEMPCIKIDLKCGLSQQFMALKWQVIIQTIFIKIRCSIAYQKKNKMWLIWCVDGLMEIPSSFEESIIKKTLEQCLNMETSVMCTIILQNAYR